MTDGQTLKIKPFKKRQNIRSFKKNKVKETKKFMITIKKPVIETRAMPSSIEKRNILLEEMETLVDRAKAEKRSLNYSENHRFEAIKREIEQIDKQTEKRERHETRTIKRAGEDSEEVRSFIRFVQSGEMRDLSASGSGVVIPKTIAEQVISKVKELAPIYARMTHFNVPGHLSLPTFDYTSQTTSFISEFTQITASGGSFLTVDLKAHAIGTLAKIGKSLLNQTNLDVIQVITNQMAMSIANFLSNEIINNTNARFSGTLKSVTQSVSGGVTADNLVALQMQVPSQYQEKSEWLMHPSTFATVRQMKSANGSFLMISDNEGFGGDIGYRLLGRPVLLDENMPTFAVGARAIYYGSFAGMYCNTNSPLVAQVLLEKYSDEYAVGIVSTQELDINLAEQRSLAVLIGA